MKMETDKDLVDELTRVYVTHKTGFVQMETVERMLKGLPGMLRDLARYAEVVGAQAKGGLTKEERDRFDHMNGSRSSWATSRRPPQSPSASTTPSSRPLPTWRRQRGVVADSRGRHGRGVGRCRTGTGGTMMIPVVKAVSVVPVTITGFVLGWAAVCVCTPILVGAAIALRLVDKAMVEVRRRADAQHDETDREMLRRLGWTSFPNRVKEDL